MLCEKCQKKEANVSVKTLINGVSESHHLCSDCAQKENLFHSGFGLDSFSMGNNIGKTLFKFPFANYGDSKTQIDRALREETYCPHCNQSLNDFKQTGLFGCPECYKTFRAMIRNMLDQIQGNHIHHDANNITLDQPQMTVGSIPKIATRETCDILSNEPSEVENLKRELQQMIKLENYEQAAILRDKIKKLSSDEQAIDKNV